MEGAQVGEVQEGISGGDEEIGVPAEVRGILVDDADARELSSGFVFVVVALDGDGVVCTRCQSRRTGAAPLRSGPRCASSPRRASRFRPHPSRSSGVRGLG